MFSYIVLPHLAAARIVTRESSSIIAPADSFTAVSAFPEQIPTSANEKTGISFTLFPVTATTSPSLRCNWANLCLSPGVARLIIFIFGMICRASSSDIFANSSPVISFSWQSVSCQTPAVRAISLAVVPFSPVTIFIFIPALRHCITVSGMSGRMESDIIAVPIYFSFPAAKTSAALFSQASRRLRAKESVRMPLLR